MDNRWNFWIIKDAKKNDFVQQNYPGRKTLGNGICFIKVNQFGVSCYIIYVVEYLCQIVDDPFEADGVISWRASQTDSLIFVDFIAETPVTKTSIRDGTLMLGVPQ